MHDEDGFLAAIRQTPADDIARLVFADWLDEQDSPSCRTKAEFIRLELRMADQPATTPDRLASLFSLRSLAAAVPNDWVTVVSRPKLDTTQACSGFACPGKWELLAPTSFDDMRRCGQCKRVARFCASIYDARKWWGDGMSVAVSPAVERTRGDLRYPVPGPLRISPRVIRGRVQLTPEMIERLRLASACGAVPAPLPQILPPPPPPAPSATEWLPAVEPEARTPRRSRKAKRKKGRQQHRSIERKDWEGEG